MSYSSKVTFWEDEKAFKVISYGMGAAYEVQRMSDGASFFLQDSEDVLRFSLAWRGNYSMPFAKLLSLHGWDLLLEVAA